MTKMYRVTQTGDIEEREDDKPLPKGFSSDLDEIERIAAEIKEDPRRWAEHLQRLASETKTEGESHAEGQGIRDEEGLDQEDRRAGQPQAADVEGQPAEGIDGGQVKRRRGRPRKNK